MSGLHKLAAMILIGNASCSLIMIMLWPKNCFVFTIKFENKLKTQPKYF